MAAAAAAVVNSTQNAASSSASATSIASSSAVQTVIANNSTATIAPQPTASLGSQLATVIAAVSKPQDNADTQKANNIVTSSESQMVENVPHQNNDVTAQPNNNASRPTNFGTDDERFLVWFYSP